MTNMTFNEIVEYWKSNGIILNEPVAHNTINELEEFLNFKFPQDFKEFYTKVNGFKEGEMDENMFSIFNLNRIKEEFKLNHSPDFIPFCDFMINSHQIGFSRIEKGIFINYENTKFSINDFVSNTFAGTLIEIINNTDKVY